MPASLIYLALPSVIFFIGWLNPFFAVLCIVLTSLPLVLIIRYSSHASPEAPIGMNPPLAPSHLIFIVMLSVLVVAHSGVGGFGFQDGDWLKHNAILRDLVERPWPVVYEIEGTPLPLVYYVAYYLPAALTGIVAGWFAVEQVLFVWTVFGVALAIVWFVTIVGSLSYLVPILFVVFSGLDVLGVACMRLLGTPLDLEHLEFWADNWQYSSNISLLFWVPNQSVAAWIISGVMMHAILRAHAHGNIIFYISLTPLWSPFITLGLLPYACADLLAQPGRLRARFRRYQSWQNLSGVALLAVFALFYASKLSPVPVETPPHGLVFHVPLGSDHDWFIIVQSGIWFVLLEFGLYAIFIASSGMLSKMDIQTKTMFVAVVVFLSLLPLYRYGEFNDLVMRASIPSLFVLAVFVGKALSGTFLTGIGRKCLIGLVLIASLTPLLEIKRHVMENYRGNVLDYEAPVNARGRLPVLRAVRNGPPLGQYVGSNDTPFFTLLARRNSDGER